MQAEGLPNPQRVVGALRSVDGSRAFGIQEGFTVQSVHPRSGKTTNGLELTYIGRDGKVGSPRLVRVRVPSVPPPPGLTRPSWPHSPLLGSLTAPPP